MRNVLGLALLVGIVGCTSHNNNHSPDLGCIPGTTECVDSTLARVCTDTGWLAKACPAGSMCTGGDCGMPSVSAAPCLPGSKVCVGNSVLACSATGFGYTSTDCPTGTNCVGGACKGFCTVGNTGCQDPGGRGTTLLTCTDGFTQTASTCPSGTLCVVDNTALGTPGICVKGACAPDLVNGCNVVCGVQGGPSPSPAANNFVSTCTNTNSPLGWQWLAQQCQGAATCDPIGADCNTRSKQQAACVTQCTPGSVRCAFGQALAAQTQTCDANGNWSAPSPCADGLVCSTAAVVGSAVCSDPACANGAKGICANVSGASQIQACVNGRLAASPAPCTVGTCVQDKTTTANGWNVGVCEAECQTGDLRCTVAGPGPGGEVQGCDATGLWSNTVTACAASTHCRQFLTATGRPSAVCGACTPGTHNCADLNDIQTCDLTGQFGAPVACTFGQCHPNNTLGDNECFADCLPGSLVCIGFTAPSPEPGVIFPGTSGVVTCSDKGLNAFSGFLNLSGPGGDPCYGAPASIPAGVTCCSVPGSGTIGGGCRKDIGGNSLGCVICVGSTVNEEGLIDTRCTDPNSTQTCLANNTGWQTAVPCATGSCQHPVPTPQPASPNTVPAGAITPVCHNCPGGSGANPNCTDSAWNGLGSSCVNQGLGGPMSCANPFVINSNIADCCADACYLDNANTPTPAVCAN